MKKIRLCVNGTWREVIVDRATVLLDLLREDLRLTGAKQSCDRKGQCGACTVVVNGKAVRSCLTRVADLEGADIITVEGLGTPDNPHLIQEAFVLAGAIQCGFCTPGMIMAAKALLDRNPRPTEAQVREGLADNLCRCGTHNRIVRAVLRAAQANGRI
jgi:aldehyde oxidoreductase